VKNALEGVQLREISSRLVESAANLVTCGSMSHLEI
jgi:hypothetical protein